MKKPRDQDLGLTKRQVELALKALGLSWASFEAWHYGQTAAIDSKGRVRYYRWDVERFLGNPNAPVLD